MTPPAITLLPSKGFCVSLLSTVTWPSTLAIISAPLVEISSANEKAKETRNKENNGKVVLKNFMMDMQTC